MFNYRVLNIGWEQIFFARAQTGLTLTLSGSLLFIGFMLYAGVALRHLYIPPLDGGSGTVTISVAKAFYRGSTIIMKGLTYVKGAVSSIPSSIRSLTGPTPFFALNKDNGARKTHEEGRKYSFFETLEGLPTLVVLAIVFSAIVTTDLWSYSSSIVLDSQDPTLPYALTLIGYVGMSVSAFLIGLKLIRGVEHNTDSKD